MSGEGRSNNSNQSNASGTGRSSGGRHHKSRKKQPNKSSNDNGASGQKKMTEQRCAPKQPGKVHSVACDQLKDHVALQTQQTCDHRLDIADSLRQLKG